MGWGLALAAGWPGLMASLWRLSWLARILCFSSTLQLSSSRLAQSQVSPSKSRSKLEALDTLVISTIHNVSNKLCSSSAGVLRQAAAVFPDQDEEQVRL